MSMQTNKGIAMKNVLKLAAGIACTAVLLGLSTGVQAQGYPDVNWNINIGSGGAVYGAQPLYGPQPVYRQPPVVVATPGPVVYQAPMYVHPRPVIVAPAPVYYGYRAPGYQGRGHWDHGHGRGPGHGHGRGNGHGDGHGHR
jgi:hypothetical protein